MTNKEIFRRVLIKTENNGFKLSPLCILLENEPYIEGCDFLKYKNLVQIQVDTNTATYLGLESIIFSHAFAKAFWGEWERVFGYETELKWQYHLQQMVLEKEPLKYLENFCEIKKIY